MCKEEIVIQYGDGVIYRRRFLAVRTELVSNEKERNNKKRGKWYGISCTAFWSEDFCDLKFLNFQEIWQKSPRLERF